MLVSGREVRAVNETFTGIIIMSKRMYVKNTGGWGGGVSLPPNKSCYGGSIMNGSFYVFQGS